MFNIVPVVFLSSRSPLQAARDGVRDLDVTWRSWPFLKGDSR